MNYNVNLKKKLRQNLIAKRKQLTTQEVKSLSKKIFDNINDIFGIEFLKNLILLQVTCHLIMKLI